MYLIGPYGSSVLVRSVDRGVAKLGDKNEHVYLVDTQSHSYDMTWVGCGIDTHITTAAVLPSTPDSSISNTSI